MKKLLALLVSVTMLFSLAAAPVSAIARSEAGLRTGEHDPVNFFMTDMDDTEVTSVEDGGTGFGTNKFTYLGISEGSDMYSCQYLIDYPEEFVSITAQSNSWSGGIIAQTTASIDDDEQTSDLFDSVANIAYEGGTGGKPVGEEGNMYINGGVYLKSFDFMGVQLGGNFHRFTLRLDKTPYQSDCQQDEGGYYLPIGLEMLEFTFAQLGDDGIIHASVNYCKPEYDASDWLSWTSGKIYVTPKEDPAGPNDHGPVNFYMTDMDNTGVTSVEDGGTGFGDNKFTYLGVSAESGMYSCQYLIDYPEEFVTITAQSNSWSGGLIAQTLASIDDDEQTSDNFDSVANIAYEGGTGGKPVGEEGNMYINGGVYLKSFDFYGVQLGGYFHRFTLRMDKMPSVADCAQDDNGYYLPIGLEMLEFTFAQLGDDGIIHASVNFCKPENAVDWLSWTSGRIYVTPKADVQPTEEPTPEPTEVPVYGPVTFTVGSIDNVEPGSTVTIPVTLDADAPYQASVLAMFIEYDSQYLTVKSVNGGDLWAALPDDAMKTKDYTTNPGKISIGVLCPITPMTGTGVLVNIEFEVSADCREDQPVTARVEEFTFSVDLETAIPIENTTVDGVIGVLYVEPTPVPTEEPTPVPTEEPTPVPTEEPTPVPTEEPTPVPTEEPTPVPTEEPTPVPTEEPTPVPTEEPTPEPTEEPTPVPVEVVRFTVGSAEDVHPGETVTIPVNVEELESYEAHVLRITIAYDAENLTVASVTAGELLAGLPEDALVTIDYTSIPGKIFIVIVCPTEGLSGSGNIVNVEFTAAEGCTEDQAISIEIGEFAYCPIDGGIVNLLYYAEGGAIYMHYEEPMLLGDVNADGVVDAADALLLLRWVLGLVSDEELHLEVADVSFDGDVTVNDVLLILRYAMGLIPGFEAPGPVSKAGR